VGKLEAIGKIFFIKNFKPCSVSGHYEQLSPTARLLAPSDNISRPICFHCHSIEHRTNTLLTL